MDYYEREYESRFVERPEPDEDAAHDIRRQRRLDMDERDDQQEYAELYQQEQWEQQAERDLPQHKRSGYAERMYEMADDYRKRMREEAA